MKAEREQPASRWLRQAEVDLEDAKYLLEGVDTTWSASCLSKLPKKL